MDAGDVSGACPFVFLMHPETLEAMPVQWSGPWSAPRVVLGYYGRATWLAKPYRRATRVCVADLYRCRPARTHLGLSRTPPLIGARQPPASQSQS
jgi:hypothetical protein